ncbi:MAG: FprA family A-type flavoprotein [Clostridia bacterium]
MYCVKELSEKLYYIGVNDRRTELFENMLPISRGVSYNSYILKDEKTVLFDTVDSSAFTQFSQNIEKVLDGRKLDYIIVNHMEPDHAASLKDILAKYPEAQIVGNAKTFAMIKQFFNCPINEHAVKEGDVLETGEHKLTFVMAPMVHWPEVMVTYDMTSKTLFSADAFGTFGALDGRIFADEYNFEAEFLDDARRYFTNIVGKYGAQAAAALTKASKLEINMVCPLHGPVFRDELITYFLEKQMTWSKYTPEEPDTIFLAYASMYGNTESVVNAVAMQLSELGKKLKVINICNTDKSFLVAEAFKCGKLIIATPTYNGGIYPTMETFLLDLKALNLQSRDVHIIENGSWAPTASKKVAEIIGSMKGMNVVSTLSMKSALHDEEKFNEFIKTF